MPGKTYILPTRHGILFLILLTAMLIGSVNYNNNMGFLLTFLLGSMGIVSAVHTYQNLDALGIAFVKVRPVFAGETARFEIRIQAGNRTRSAIRLRLDAMEIPLEQTLAAHQELRIDLPVAALQRGILSSGPLQVDAIYPLGLFRAWFSLSPGIECVVYPTPVYGPFRPASRSQTNGGDGNGTPGPGVDDFENLKPYQPGDSLRHIAWKAYSKGQGLFSKKFQGETGARLCLDWAEVQAPDLERRISLMCGMVLTAHRLNLEYSLQLPDQRIGPDSGERHKTNCLRHLALMPHSHETERN